MNVPELRAFRKHIRQFERSQKAQLDNFNCCCNLTLSQCHVLLELEEAGETSTRTLADILRLDASTLSRTIHSLVKSSLVERNEHPTDRRVVLLSLSESGRRLCEEINQRNDRYFSMVLSNVPEDERQSVGQALALLVKAMTAVEQASDTAKAAAPECEGCR